MYIYHDINSAACTGQAVTLGAAPQNTVVSPSSEASLPTCTSSSPPSAEEATNTNGTLGTSTSINSARLMVIKWRDDDGNTQKFRLIDKIKHSWRDIGRLINISPDELDQLSEKDAGECCKAVLERWMKAPPPDYPVMWDALMELLEDAGVGNVVSELKTILYKANIL